MQEQLPTPAEKTEKRRRFLINFTYFVLLFAISIFIVRYALGALMPFIIALIVTLILRPAVRLIKNKIGIKSRLVEPVLAILFYCTIGVIAALIVFEVAKSLGSIISYLPSFYSNSVSPTLSSAISAINGVLDRLDLNYTLSTGTILSSLGSAITSLSGAIISSAGDIALATPSFLINVVITVVATVFMLMDLDLLVKFANHQLSEKNSLLVHNVLLRLKFVIKKYILSYAAIMLITFAEIWVGLSILGVTNAALIAAIIAAFDILPVVGASLVILPWAAISLITGNIGLAIGLIVLLAILAVVRNIIEPKIVGSSVGMHPLLTLFSMLVGSFIYGPIGILLMPVSMALIQNLVDGGILHLYKTLEKEETEEKPSKLNAFINSIFDKCAAAVVSFFKKIFKRKKKSDARSDNKKINNKKGNDNG